jgi:hypothetical protein
MDAVTPCAAAELARVVTTAGYRVIAEHETAVVADRPLPGGAVGDLRSLVFTRPTAEVPWVASCYVRRRVDLEPLTCHYRCLHRSAALADALEIELWIGGASSIPADAREIRVLETA